MKYINTAFTSVLCGSLLCLAQAGNVFGQTYNEDEWYDPTDWFDGNNFEFDDSTANDWGWDQYEFGDYEYDDYDPNEFGVDDYRYDNTLNRWNYDNQPADTQNFGWHYEWSPTRNRWLRQYGYYDTYYDYIPGTTQRQTQPRQSQSRPQFAQPSRQPSPQSSGQPAGQQVVRGEIDFARSVNLTDRSGNRARHRVAQVRLEDGRWVLVDLGRDERNLRASLNEGDRIVVRGQTGRLNGRRVLMANQVQINGRNYQISRTGLRQSQSQQQQQQQQQQRPSQQLRQQQQQQQQAGSQQMGQSRYITGRAVSAQPVSFGDSMNRNCFRLQLQNGQSLLVDLGTRTSLEDLDINRDDLVTVQGRNTTMSGRQVFRANTVWVNGKETRISQSMARR